MIIFPKAKINIGLRITYKREDGFHNVETIFYPVNLTEAFEYIVPEEVLNKDHLEVTGLGTGCPPEDNILLKVLEKLRGKYKIPYLKMHLHKTIPQGAGLGGGSSDATCFLKSLNRYFDLNMNALDLKETALSLGSDCPFFVDFVPSFAKGRGELLTPLDPLPGTLYIVIVYPGIQINTKEAYGACKPVKSMTNLEDTYYEDIRSWKGRIVNDFENVIFPEYPEIAAVKDSFYRMGALFSSMSGSGSSVYGIFREKPTIGNTLRKKVVFSGFL